MNIIKVNEVMLRRRNSIVLPEHKDFVQADNTAVMSITADCLSLGYVLGTEVTDAMSTMDMTDLTEFASNLIEIMKEEKGCTSRGYYPLFCNFPADIMEAADAKDLASAVGVFASSGKWPDRNPVPIEDENYTVVHLASYEDYCTIMKNLMSAATPMGLSEKEDVTDFFANEPFAYKSIPDEIPVKENLVHVAMACIKSSTPIEFVEKLFKTPTDVLRLAAGMCDSDTNLVSVRFHSLPRKTRKFILSLLSKMSKNSSFEEDMKSNRALWIRLGEVLHPGEFKQFANVTATFSKLRNNVDIPTFAGQLEAAIARKDEKTLLRMLTSRPGIFARKLDEVLRNSTNQQDVLNAFRKVASNIPTTTLLQLKTHFAARNEVHSRVFFPKGAVTKAFTEESVLPTLPDKLIANVVKICENALVSQYSQRNGLGYVYVSPDLKQYNIPTGMRTAAKTLKPVAKGSKFPIPEGTVLRPFLYWSDGHDRTDIDLSVVVFDESYNPIRTVAYYDLSDKTLGIYHSGDITSAPFGAAEFVDIDMAKLKASKGRYVAITINSYTYQPYCDLPDCFAGWMTRSAVLDGKAFEPTTVKNRFDITGNRTTSLVGVVDVDKNFIIWGDMAFESNITNVHENNVANHLTGISAVVKSLVEMQKPTLYELFTLNAQARGILVDTPEEADTVFSEDDTATVKPTDIDVIMSDYL